MKSLREKVVVITGAGSGIGRALAVEAARRGAFLALSDWNEDGVKETERVAGAERSLSRKVNVRSEDAVSAFADEVARELGGAHAIVNNAGVSVSDYVGTMKRIDFEWLMDINFWGVVRGTEVFLPQLKAKDDAHVVNISSVFGLIGVPSQSAYNASKFAVRGYTEALRQELVGTSVHVTLRAPGRGEDEHREERAEQHELARPGDRPRHDGAGVREDRPDDPRGGGEDHLGRGPLRRAAGPRRRRRSPDRPGAAPLPYRLRLHLPRIPAPVRAERGYQPSDL